MIFFRAIGRSVARAIISRSASRMGARGYNKSYSQRSAVRERARLSLRLASRGKYGAASELAEEIGELYEEAAETVEAAFYEAMDTMFGMTANPGQETVFSDHVIPAFSQEMESTEIGEPWNDVDIGEYMAFMGEIVEAGNAIMAEAFDEAASLQGEADDAEADLEALEEEGLDPDEFF